MVMDNLASRINLRSQKIRDMVLNCLTSKVLCIHPGNACNDPVYEKIAYEILQERLGITATKKHITILVNCFNLLKL